MPGLAHHGIGGMQQAGAAGRVHRDKGGRALFAQPPTVRGCCWRSSCSPCSARPELPVRGVPGPGATGSACAGAAERPNVHSCATLIAVSDAARSNERAEPGALTRAGLRRVFPACASARCTVEVRSAGSQPVAGTTWTGNSPIRPDSCVRVERVGHQRSPLPLRRRYRYIGRGYRGRGYRRRGYRGRGYRGRGNHALAHPRRLVGGLPVLSPNHARRIRRFRRDRRASSGGPSRRAATHQASNGHERLQRRAELSEVPLREIDLVAAAVQREVHRGGSLRAVEIVNQPGFHISRQGRSIRKYQQIEQGHRAHHRRYDTPRTQRPSARGHCRCRVVRSPHRPPNASHEENPRASAWSTPTSPLRPSRPRLTASRRWVRSVLDRAPTPPCAAARQGLE
jgi:hypothetical protein